MLAALVCLTFVKWGVTHRFWVRVAKEGAIDVHSVRDSGVSTVLWILSLVLACSFNRRVWIGLVLGLVGCVLLSVGSGKLSPAGGTTWLTTVVGGGLCSRLLWGWSVVARSQLIRSRFAFVLRAMRRAIYEQLSEWFSGFCYNVSFVVRIRINRSLGLKAAVIFTLGLSVIWSSF